MIIIIMQKEYLRMAIAILCAALSPPRAATNMIKLLLWRPFIMIVSIIIIIIIGVEQILAFWQNLPEFLSRPDKFNAVVSLNLNGDNLITTFIDFKFLHTQQRVISRIFQYLK